MFTAAIPTKYKNINFRSRLEARWAAFFDLIEVSWEYEPIDLKGYIPDFIITSFYTPQLVEIKPSLNINQLHTYIPKIKTSGWEGVSLLLGARFFGECDYGHTLLGLFLKDNDPDFYKAEFCATLEQAEASWLYARFMRCKDICPSLPTITVGDNFLCLRCQSSIVGENSILEEELWREAGNIVQYKKAA